MRMTIVCHIFLFFKEWQSHENSTVSSYNFPEISPAWSHKPKTVKYWKKKQK